MENGKFEVYCGHLENVCIALPVGDERSSIRHLNIVYYINESSIEPGLVVSYILNTERECLRAIAEFLHTYCVRFWHGAHSSEYKSAIKYANIYLKQFAESMEINEYLNLYDNIH